MVLSIIAVFDILTLSTVLHHYDANALFLGKPPDGDVRRRFNFTPA
ncbi:hypothetical protein I545_0773 [Mycobacterium kansasii 662]|uniref:Uncharacterized protein n=1 Tax=Mycobacterium kansasii 662 TaxID=1299326 RepID=X7ZPK6_MYCKA|nr:hypothetical protein I545_0773 [Mycobacterium kansasii 662]